MWKKLKEASSEVTLNKVTNLFRGKTYSKFGNTDELSDNHGIKENKSDNKTVRLDTRIFNRAASLEQEDNVTIGEDSDSDDLYGFEQYENKPRKSRFSNSEDNIKLHSPNENRVPSQRYQNGLHVPNPKTEVEELVNSFTQRRYQQLEDSDEFDDVHMEHTDSQISDNVDGNVVFHKAEDLQQGKVGRPLKRRKSKKITKQTRKFVRRSWKWIKRGFIGYAMGMKIPNIFIVVHTRS